MTRMRKICLIFLLIISAKPSVWANGGTFATSSVYATGNMLPERKQKIELVDELLEVSLDGDWADVNVTYTLQNHGGADTMTYGFPVDATVEGMGQDSEQSIEDFTVVDGGKVQDISKEIKMPNPANDSGYTEEPYAKTVRDWFITTLKFQRRETKTLVVSYKVLSAGTRSGTSKSIFWGESPRTFTYTFKPADTWGNGRLHHLEIVVDTTKLQTAHIPVNTVAPPGGQNESGKLHWVLTDVQLSQSPDLVINYDNSDRRFAAQVNGARLDPQWIESIRVSSTHAPSSKANYEARNLLDNRLDTAWIPGTKGPGVGEWIDVRFKKPVSLGAVGIINGYLKSPQLLDENGWVSRAIVNVYPTTGEDWTEDLQNTDLKQTSFPAANADPPASVQWIFDSGDSHIETKHIRLTIKKAQPGSRYPDTAISELYILGEPVDQ